MPHGKTPWAEIPLYRPDIKKRISLELSIIAGILQNHLWLETLDTYVLAEPGPPILMDTYVVKDTPLREQIISLNREMANKEASLENYVKMQELADQRFDKVLDANRRRISSIQQELDEAKNEIQNYEDQMVNLTLQLQQFEVEQQSQIEELKKLNAEEIQNAIEKTLAGQRALIAKRDDLLNEKFQEMGKIIQFILTLSPPGTVLTPQDLNTPEKMENVKQLIIGNLSQSEAKRQMEIKLLRQNIQEIQLAQQRQLSNIDQERRQQLSELQQNHSQKIRELQNRLLAAENKLTEETKLRKELEIELDRVKRKYHQEFKDLDSKIVSHKETVQNLESNLHKRGQIEKELKDQVNKINQEKRLLAQAYNDAKLAKTNLEEKIVRLESEIQRLSKQVFGKSAREQQERTDLATRISALERINFDLVQQKVTGISYNNPMDLLYVTLANYTDEDIIKALNYLGSGTFQSNPLKRKSAANIQPMKKSKN